jgi:ferredoxin
MGKVNQKKCIGCGGCVAMYPETFELKDGKARIKDNSKFKKEMKSICPVEAIED